MEILREYPPNYYDIVAAFPAVKFRPSIIFAWSPNIYNPSGNTLPFHIIEHEKVHHIQQRGEPELWWKMYLLDAAFRLEQETQAYQRQWDVVQRMDYDRKQRRELLAGMARDLSGPMYGRIVSFEAAKKTIRLGL